MVFLAIIWTIFFICFSTEVKSYHICDSCDCSIGEQASNNRAVQNVKPICNEGSFKWYNMYGGALTIDFKPTFRREFQLCFILKVKNVKVQVSEEKLPEGSSVMALSKPPTLKNVVVADDRTDEICIPSSNKRILLFLEPERTVKSRGFSFVYMKYVMEKRNDALMLNSMEECRPCTDEELLQAYCSHDVVVEGSMANVTHVEERYQTDIKIKVSKVIRRRKPVFEEFSKIPRLSETLSKHRKCNVRYGPGQFLFTGKWRLGQLKLLCSPYLHDWNAVLKYKSESGDSLNCFNSRL